MAEFVDPRMTNIKPRIRYNTIGGINGPLVVLDNVRLLRTQTDTGDDAFLLIRIAAE